MNTKLKDSSSKLIFGDPILCAQFLRDYINIPLLKNIKPEDIEDVSERYVSMNAEERNADTVKRITIPERKQFFLISLIEHKTTVDYNVTMQLLRYMVCIWGDYEKEMKIKSGGNISQRKDFTYPPILPIVYYEGKREWTAITNFKDRVLFNDIFAKYIPTFSYELVNLHQYSNLELASHNDEISLLMLLNRVQDMDDFKELLNLRGFRKDAWENTPEYLLDIMVHITTILLSRLNLPEEEVDEFVSQIKERNMPELFEHFKGYDVQATRKEASTKGRLEGMREGKLAGKIETKVSLICKKLAKFQTEEEIAAALEEDLTSIHFICEIAKKYAPEYDITAICGEIMQTASHRLD